MVHLRYVRILFTLLIVVYAVLPLFAELNHTHVVNPDWPGHARLHNVWLIAQNSLLGLFSLYLLWALRNRAMVLIAGGLSTIIFAGFVIAGITSSLYGGTFTDKGAGVFLIDGVDINVYVFGISFILSVIGLTIVAKTKTQHS